MRTRFVLPAVVAAAGLFLGACSSSSDQDATNASDTGSSMDMSSSESGDSTTSLTIAEDAAFNATDVAFVQGMIPHHGQAVEMADKALATSTNPDITALAEQIKAAQSPEIAQMTSWLTDWDQTIPDPNAVMDNNMDHSGGMMMSGMMSAADMARLENATGTEFDKMFLEMMVLHHEGAIEMAQQEVDEGKYQATKDLAQAVITGQQAEIDEMNTLIAGLPA